MLRFIVKRSQRDAISGAEGVEYETLDAECPDLQSALLSGGHGPEGHDIRELIGVEILRGPDPSSNTQ